MLYDECNGGIILANYIFYDFQKAKDDSAISAAYNHNERQKEAYLSNPNIKSEYRCRNYHFKRADCPYSEQVSRRIRQSGAKVTKRSVLMIDGVFSPSPEWINSKSFTEQMEIFSRAYEYVVARYGYENVIAAVVHMDEDNPHMHFDAVPITVDNRVCISDVFPYPDGKNVEQSMFFEHMQSYFPELTRGIPKLFAQRDHVAMKYFKAAPDYFDMHEKMVAAINSIDLSKKNINENKQMAIALYTAISKMAAYTIVMQQGEINYYKNRLIPGLKKRIDEQEAQLALNRQKNMEPEETKGKCHNEHISIEEAQRRNLQTYKEETLMK